MPAAVSLEPLPDISCPDIDRCVGKGLFEKTFSAAACVASVGKIVFHRSIAGSPTQPPPLRRLHMDTLFDLASLTKPLATGLAALLLASRNRIDLGAPLSKTIPEFRTGGRFAEITIDMLLDHTSGLPAFRSFWERIREHDEKLAPNQRVMGTRKAVPLVKKWLAETPLEADPGTKMIYSDLGFMALGWIIEGIVGKPLDVFVEREIYRPMGLADDLFFIRLDDMRARQRLHKRVFAATEDCPWRKKLLQGEVHDPNAWAMGGVAGHAGLFGTADAVWRLTSTLWASFRGLDRTFLSGTVRRFWTKSKRVRGTTRALAWDTPSFGSSAGKRFSLNSIGHLGFTGGSIWIDLSTDVMGVVLTNSAHPTPDGKQEAMATFRPRIYELIGKEGESAATGGRVTGAAAFYDGPIRGPGR